MKSHFLSPGPSRRHANTRHSQAYYAPFGRTISKSSETFLPREARTCLVPSAVLLWECRLSVCNDVVLSSRTFSRPLVHILVSMVSWSVTLSDTFVHCGQTAEDNTHDFFCIRQPHPCLCQLALKFGLNQSTSSSLNFVPRWPTSLLIWSSEKFNGKLQRNG